MMSKNKKTIKKGITPVIAIVLLLMMTVAAAGLAYEFIMNMSETQTKAIGAQVDAQSDKMKTDLKILQIKNISGGFLFYIKNVGSIEMGEVSKTNTDLKIDGKRIISVTIDGECTDNSIAIGETCALNMTKVSGGTDFKMPNVGITKNFEIMLSNGYVMNYGCNVAKSTHTYC